MLYFYYQILLFPESVLKRLQRIEPSIRDHTEYKRGSGVRVRVGFVPDPRHTHQLLLFVMYGRSPVGFRAEMTLTHDGASWILESNKVIRDM